MLYPISTARYISTFPHRWRTAGGRWAYSPVQKAIENNCQWNLAAYYFHPLSERSCVSLELICLSAVILSLIHHRDVGTTLFKHDVPISNSGIYSWGSNRYIDNVPVKKIMAVSKRKRRKHQEHEIVHQSIHQKTLKTHQEKTISIYEKLHQSTSSTCTRNTSFFSTVGVISSNLTVIRVSAATLLYAVTFPGFFASNSAPNGCFSRAIIWRARISLSSCDTDEGGGREPASLLQVALRPPNGGPKREASRPVPVLRAEEMIFEGPGSELGGNSPIHED